MQLLEGASISSTSPQKSPEDEPLAEADVLSSPESPHLYVEHLAWMGDIVSLDCLCALVLADHCHYQRLLYTSQVIVVKRLKAS